MVDVGGAGSLGLGVGGRGGPALPAVPGVRTVACGETGQSYDGSVVSGRKTR